MTTSPMCGSSGVCPIELYNRLQALQDMQRRERFLQAADTVRGAMLIVLLFYLALSRTRLF